MQRITVIGCGGSGKSTLARKLGSLLGLPVHHLDQLYWKRGWVETAKPEWELLQQELCQQPNWIMDGNYGGTMGVRLLASDTIIFLDMPTWVCLRGALQRFLRYRGGNRPDMSEGCPERLAWDYLWWIFTYRRKRRTGVLRRLASLGPEKTVVILDSRQAVQVFLDKICLQQPV